MRRGSVWARVLLVSLAALLLSAARAGESPGRERGVSGRLSEHEGLTVLELWGTPEEAGYAHGFLLAEQIVSLVDGYVLDEKVVPNPQVYETLLVPGVRRQFVWSPAHEQEFRAIARGMRDRLGADKPRSQVLGRELKVEDLMVANALADWFGMLCSTFAAWGSLTQDGQTLTARNLDFPSTGLMERQQLVVIRRGEGTTRPWVGVSWPGLIGAYTAMNGEGVTIAMHDAAGLTPSEAIGFTARALILREALEGATAGAFVEDVLGVFQSRWVMVGNNIHVSAPLLEGRPPAVVFEYDANAQGKGVTVRSVEATGGAGGNALWCTNHLRLRRPPRECWRFERIGQRLRRLVERGERLDPPGALELIGTVRQEMTLHSVCFVPHEKTMYVCIPAISERVVEFRLDEWLNRPTGRTGQQKQAAFQGGRP